MADLSWADDRHCSNPHNLQILQFARNRIIYLVDVTDLEDDKTILEFCSNNLLQDKYFIWTYI